MKKAWIDNGIIRDITDGNPHEMYHHDIAGYYNVDVTDDAESGDTWDGVKHGKPQKETVVDAVELEAVAPILPKLSPIEFKMLFTVQERIAIKALRDTDPVIGDFFDLLDDVRLTAVDLSLKSTMSAIDYAINAVSATLKYKDDEAGKRIGEIRSGTVI